MFDCRHMSLRNPELGSYPSLSESPVEKAANLPDAIGIQLGDERGPASIVTGQDRLPVIRVNAEPHSTQVVELKTAGKGSIDPFVVDAKDPDPLPIYPRESIPIPAGTPLPYPAGSSEASVLLNVFSGGFQPVVPSKIFLGSALSIAKGCIGLGIYAGFASTSTQAPHGGNYRGWYLYRQLQEVVGMKIMAKSKKAVCFSIRCIGCNKMSQFYGKNKMLAMKQAFVYRGWKVLRLDEYTCPDCTDRIHFGEIPIPEAKSGTE